mgnify:CR=1 FL=1
MNSYLRKKTVFYSTIIIFFPIFLKFFELQILDYNKYKKLAGNNSLRSIEIKAPRGIIYDRNGIPLAENITKGDFWVDTNKELDIGAISKFFYDYFNCSHILLIL